MNNICIIILLSFAVLLFFGMIGDKEQQNRNNFTYGFIAVITAIASMNVLPIIFQ